jgi:ABC-type polysaccharide/polyol phosphate export permease
VPRDLLTRPMEIAATFNPVTYVMEALRSLILQDFAWAPLAHGFGVVVVLGVVMVILNVRLIRDYDYRRSDRTGILAVSRYAGGVNLLAVNTAP